MTRSSDTVEKTLMADGKFDEVEGIRSEVRSYVEDCAGKAVASPMPDPEAAATGVFADAIEPLGDGHAPWSHWAQGRSGNGAAPMERRAA